MRDVDDEFYNRADAHIRLSNDQISEKLGRGKVSASMMFSVARFNSWVAACGWNSRDEMREGKKETMDYLVEQYRKMLEENLDDYIENFNKHMQVSEENA